MYGQAAKKVHERRSFLQYPVDKLWGRCYHNKALASRVTVFLGVAQFGSVLEWGSRGRRFESSHPDQIRSKVLFAPIFLLFSARSAPKGKRGRMNHPASFLLITNFMLCLSSSLRPMPVMNHAIPDNGRSEQSFPPGVGCYFALSRFSCARAWSLSPDIPRSTWPYSVLVSQKSLAAAPAL